MSSPATLEEQPTTQPLTLSLLKVYKKLKEIKNFAALVLNKKKNWRNNLFNINNHLISCEVLFTSFG
jgi:hypothetical protein